MMDFDGTPFPPRNTRYARGFKYVTSSAAARRAYKRRARRGERRRGADAMRGVRPRARVASDRDVA